MKRLADQARRYALTVALLLTAIAAGMAIYAVLQVEAERTASILRACNDQNAKHTATIKQLDVLLSKAARSATAVRRREIQATRAPTVLLIDQLAPYQNCSKVLAKSTSTK